ncbi:hypothetical protein BDA99DRAFT_548714 [Phascolomyces articulosus]|uniref:Uncharacterized protein n=1 Tax=Phascolomyces articulosus TaxID=60185 RepID=A0AAD5K0Z0_9FUNG|nr:hypothetical protein BDA99DRAFT_548714 [Phascolomyces articulosus]
MQTVTFYHYQPLVDYVCDGLDSETDDQLQFASIKTLYKLDHLSDDSMSEDETESSNGAPDISMEERELGWVSNPNLVWTPIKCKPEQVAQFIRSIQNINVKVKNGAKIANIDLSTGTKPKQNNLKLTDDHSQFIENYVEGHPTCIVKDATDALCEAFDNLTVSQSTVYRHITEKLSFTLTLTQPKVADRNSEDILEAR